MSNARGVSRVCHNASLYVILVYWKIGGAIHESPVHFVRGRLYCHLEPINCHFEALPRNLVPIKSGRVFTLVSLARFLSPPTLRRSPSKWQIVHHIRRNDILNIHVCFLLNERYKLKMKNNMFGALGLLFIWSILKTLFKKIFWESPFTHMFIF